MRIANAALAMFVLVAGANAEDLTMVAKVTENGKAPVMSTSYFSSDRIRMAQPGGHDVIFDLRSGDTTILDANKKTYYVITRKDIEDMTAMINERMNSPEMKKAQEQMKSLPPEQQKRMQEMMGGMFAVHVTKENSGRTIAGYRCTDYTMTIGQFSRTEQCLTTELKFPEATWRQFKNSLDSMQSMMRAMGPMAKGMESMTEEMQKMKGIPLATTTTTTIMGRKSVSTSEVTSITHDPIPATAWAVPAGYTKVESPMKQAMKQGH